MKAPQIYNDAIDRVLIEGLRDAVMMRAQPGRPYPGGANRGGWKSSVDLFSWTPDPCIPELREILARYIGREYTLGNAWAVVNRKGSWHGRHRHGVPLMGLLFIASGDPMVPTVFETSDTGRMAVDPIPGRLVICGDLYHSVGIVKSETPRVAIAFDARLAA